MVVGVARIELYRHVCKLDVIMKIEDIYLNCHKKKKKERWSDEVVLEIFDFFILWTEWR